MQNQGKREITFDTQLKTALFQFIAILGDLPIAPRRQYKGVLPSQNDGF